MRRNLRGLERDSHTFHKFDTENKATPGKSHPFYSARTPEVQLSGFWGLLDSPVKSSSFWSSRSQDVASA